MTCEKGADEGTQHESARLTVSSDSRERYRLGHPARHCESALLSRVVFQLQMTCEKGADEGTQHESACLTVAGSNQRTNLKARRKEHLPCHTAIAKILTTSVHQWSNQKNHLKPKKLLSEEQKGAKRKRNRRRNEKRKRKSEEHPSTLSVQAKEAE